MNQPIDFRIRAATAADAPEIRRTVKQARLDRTGLDWRNFRIAEHPQTLEIFGFCQVRRYAGVRELGSLYVRKDIRRHGLGAALIDACLADQRPPVHLECVEARQGYYERFGFRRIARRQAPLALAIKSLIGETVTWLVLRRHIVVMRWDAPKPG